MRIGVLTSGGDAPGMNAAIHSVAKAALASGHESIGVRYGYDGLLDGDVVPLTLQNVEGIARHGGTMLGSARSTLFPTPEGQAAARDRIRALGLDGLVVIGGNGSLTGAHALCQDPPACAVVGLPASIDNDIGHTRLAIGVDTAVNTIVEACDRISDTARAHRRAFVVEVMGRDCGYLAMRAGIAAEADAILFPEADLPDDPLAPVRELLVRSFSPERAKKRVLVMLSEGYPLGTAQIVSELQSVAETAGLNVSVRATVLGHVVRGGSPSALDRLIAQRLAVAAVRSLAAGATDVMAAWEPVEPVGDPTSDRSVRLVPLAEVLAETQRMLTGTSAASRARVAMLREAERLLAM